MNKGILIFVACVIAFIVFKNYSKKAETAKPSSTGGGASTASGGAFQNPVINLVPGQTITDPRIKTGPQGNRTTSTFLNTVSPPNMRKK